MFPNLRERIREAVGKLELALVWFVPGLVDEFLCVVLVGRLSGCARLMEWTYQ